jgi:branched-chain amino acid transport system permease protein
MNLGTLLKLNKGYFISGIILALFIVYPLVVNAELSYMVYFLYSTFLYITLAQGWNLTAGYAGQASLGQHAFFGVGAYMTAISWRGGWTGYLDPLAIIMSGLVAAFLAIIVGIPLLAKLKGDYFALGTLGLGEILRVVAMHGGSFTEGTAGISLPSSLYMSMYHYYFIALIITSLTQLALWFIQHSRIGLAFTAIRDNETAAAANGIAVLKYKIIAFAGGAFLTGLCGSLNAYYAFHVHSRSAFSLNWVIVPILMACLGGVGTLWGPVLGAFILATIYELANIWMPELHPVFSGALIVLVVLFIPDGIIGHVTGRRGGVLVKLSASRWMIHQKAS